MPFKYKVISLSISITLGVIFSVLFVYWLNMDINNEQRLAANQHIIVTDAISNEVNTTLDTLNTFVGDECSPEMMVTLRRAMFKSVYIKDIGYVDNAGYLKCTTGLGTLKSAILEEGEDYISKFGAKIWVAKELMFFNKLYKSIVVQKKNYNVVVDAKDLNKLILQDFVSEVVYKTGGTYRHVLGEPNHYQAHVDEQQNLFGSHHYQQCSLTSSYCVSVTLKTDEFMKRYGLALAILAFTSLLLIVTAYITLSSSIKKHFSLQSRIKRGVKNNNFYPLFQPIVELETGRIIGCEILARYKDGLGIVYPDQFIPIVRDIGLSWEFTDKLFTKSMNLLTDSQLDNCGFKVNLNIFPCDISSGDVLNIIHHPSRDSAKFNYVLEIVEDEKLIGSEVVSYLDSLMNHKFSIAIDDFGTGYSNLQQISNIHCQTLKIDRSFINEMEDGSIRSTLIPHIVEIANKLDMSIVAEGIENAMQHKALINEGVTFGQGWMYGKPMSAGKLSTLVTTSRHL